VPLEVPSEHLSPNAALQADCVIAVERPSYGHGRRENLDGRRGFSEVSQGLIHRRDQLWERVRRNVMVRDVALDDFRDEK
jgi:hypothetical protein